MASTPLLLPSLPPVDQRAARLEARLAIYAQYANLLGAEMQAAWSAEPTQAGTLTRELARARAELAERYEELREWPEDTPIAPDAFGGMLSDAVLEIDQQRAFDQALRAQAEQLGPGARLTAGAQRLLPAGSLEVEPAFEVVGVVGTDAARSTQSESTAIERVTDVASPTAEADGTAAFGGALVAARSNGVGGMLGGQFPGVVGGASTIGGTVGPKGEDAPPAGRARLDVRF